MSSGSFSVASRSSIPPHSSKSVCARNGGDDSEEDSVDGLIKLVTYEYAWTLTWTELTYEINGKVILDGVSGQLASGQLLAVMGPSGMLRLFETITISTEFEPI